VLNRFFQAAVITFLLSLVVSSNSLKLSNITPILGSFLAHHINELIPRAFVSNRFD